MKFDRLSPSKIMPLAGILTPIAAVAVARMVLGGGPAEAPAAGIDDTVDPVVSGVGMVTKPLTETQNSALTYLRTHSEPRPLRSPMAKPSAPLIVEDTPEHLEPRPDDPSEHLVLTSIVGKGKRALASLSGKVYRVGDEVGPSWHITDINTAKREIIITSDDGETRVMKIMPQDGR